VLVNTYTVLCVGGPLGGQWKLVYERTFEAAEPPKIAFTTAMTDAVNEPFKRYRYDVEAIALFGSKMYVAVCHGEFIHSAEREKAIMRAVLQRDVANHLEAL
jgi:hypothetical protein